MNKLDFTSSLIHTVFSWPVAIVLIVLILRKSLSKVILGLSKFTYKGMGQEIDISMDIQKLKTDAAHANVIGRHERDDRPMPRSGMAPMPRDEDGKGINEDQFRGIADVSPSAAILVAWSEVESAINEAVMRSAVSPDYPPHNSALRNVQWLEKSGKITDDLARLLNDLRAIRNKAAHPVATSDGTRVSVTFDDAIEYWQVARSAIGALNLVDRSRVQSRAISERGSA